jgi:hypothetical protein
MIEAVEAAKKTVHSFFRMNIVEYFPGMLQTGKLKLQRTSSNRRLVTFLKVFIQTDNDGNRKGFQVNHFCNGRKHGNEGVSSADCWVWA